MKAWSDSKVWLTDWLTDWLAGWLADWLIDWLIDCLIDCDWPIALLIEWLTETDWLADWLTDWLDDRLTDWLIHWQIPCRGSDGNFSLRHRVQTGSGAHPPPIQRVLRILSLGVKRPEREADHSPPFYAEVKNAWSHTSTPTISFHSVVLN
jgi:hypothetical protein